MIEREFDNTCLQPCVFLSVGGLATSSLSTGSSAGGDYDRRVPVALLWSLRRALIAPLHHRPIDCWSPPSISLIATQGALCWGQRARRRDAGSAASLGRASFSIYRLLVAVAITVGRLYTPVHEARLAAMPGDHTNARWPPPRVPSADSSLQPGRARARRHHTDDDAQPDGRQLVIEAFVTPSPAVVADQTPPAAIALAVSGDGDGVLRRVYGAKPDRRLSLVVA